MDTLKAHNKSINSSRAKSRRAERSEKTRQAIFEAAAEVVGEIGYSEASIARITEKAGIAQGTFYNYFDSRQSLFDQLLPRLGGTMLSYIRDRLEGSAKGAMRERQRINAYFSFLEQSPEFYRVLYEAETLAPEAHREHIEMVASGYTRALHRSWQRGEMPHYNEDELEAIAYMLLAIRGYLSLRYGHAHSGTGIPEHVLNTYDKFMRHGLFSE